MLEQAVHSIVLQSLPPGSGPLAEAQHRARATTKVVARVLVELEERIAALEYATANRQPQPAIGDTVMNQDDEAVVGVSRHCAGEEPIRSSTAGEKLTEALKRLATKYEEEFAAYKRYYGPWAPPGPAPSTKLTVMRDLMAELREVDPL